MKLILLVIGLLYVTSSFSQKITGIFFWREGGRRPREWKADKDVFMSGDTLIFTFKNRFRGNVYCDTTPAHFTLYKVVNGKTLLVDDTLSRPTLNPRPFPLNKSITVKKIVKDPGSYFLLYALYNPPEGPIRERRLFYEQWFTVEKR